MKLAIALLTYAITVVAIALFARSIRTLIALYRKQQPDPTRSGDRAARTKNMLVKVLIVFFFCLFINMLFFVKILFCLFLITVQIYELF
jgi:hypothetical protein